MSIAKNTRKPRKSVEKAAPLMLKALRAIENWSFNTATEIPPRQYKLLRSAIEKAEGK